MADPAFVACCQLAPDVARPGYGAALAQTALAEALAGGARIVVLPELTRGLALAGAELIALPANWPREAVAVGGAPMLQSLAVTTAYLSKVFVAVCDRCGSERGLEFQGGSVIAGPDGALLAGPAADHGPATLTAACDLGRARRKRSGEHNDAFADRRPAHYAPALIRG